MTKIILCGAQGRMGQEISKLAAAGKDFKVTAAVDSKYKNNGKSEFSNIGEIKDFAADVVVDFTIAEHFDSILAWAVHHKVALVSGTTGLSNDQQVKMREAAKSIPLLWSPNMSVGVNFLVQLLEQYRSISNYQFKISETHHVNKKDKPSGTAIYLQEALQKAIGRKINTPESFREGEVFGNHQVLAYNESEEIILEHRALNREVFARGALAAVEWLVGKPAGIYSMQNVVREK